MLRLRRSMKKRPSLHAQSAICVLDADKPIRTAHCCKATGRRMPGLLRPLGTRMRAYCVMCAVWVAMGLCFSFFVRPYDGLCGISSIRQRQHTDWSTHSCQTIALISTASELSPKTASLMILWAVSLICPVSSLSSSRNSGHNVLSTNVLETFTITVVCR